MQNGIHPTVHDKAKTTCVTCGAIYLIPSTVETQTVESCRACNPVYTGKQSQVRTGGRIDRFHRRMAAGKKEEKKDEKKAE